MPRWVREVMTGGVAAVPPEAPLTQVARLMREQDIGAVVVAEGDRLVGLVTDRDLAVRAMALGLDPVMTQARSVCTPQPVVVAPGDPIEHALELMRRHAVRRLPVVESGLPVGIVSLGDLAMATDPKSALGEISSAPANR